MSEQKPSFPERIVSGCLVAIMGTGLLTLVFAAYILLGQVLLYLQRGFWPHWSAADGLLQVRAVLPSALVRWLLAPDSWYGLYAVLGGLPVSAFVFLCGLGIAMFAGNCSNAVERAKQERARTRLERQQEERNRRIEELLREANQEKRPPSGNS